MEINIDRNELVNALGLVIGAINTKNTLPVLGNVLIETSGADTLYLTATDLEVGVNTKVPAVVVKEGSVTVPAKKFFDVVRELPQGEVSVSVAKNYTVSIKAGKTYCRVMGLGKEDFPKLPELQQDNAIEIPQKALKECLGLTAFAISHDETRYVLNGVLLMIGQGKLRFIATDGRRLAYAEKKVETKEGDKQTTIEVIIPTKAVHELGKMLRDDGTVKIIQLQNQIAFHLGNTYMISRLIEGKFPNYEQVIPKEEKTIGSIHRQNLLSAIKRAALFTSQDSQAVKFDFVKDKVLISSHSPNLGEAKEEVEAEVTGDSLSIGFNPAYLLDALKILDTERVSISLSRPDKPGLLKSKEDYLYVIMPMQIA